MEMLVRLPNVNDLAKGWLFDYEFQPLLMDEPVVSRQLKFSGAHDIMTPFGAGARRERIHFIPASGN
jgi:hypothetical protein